MAEQAKLTFTQIPNQILDTMTQRTPNENLVLFAICRKTYGWAKTKDKISLSQIQEMTGLSRQGTVNNIRSLKTNGWIESEKIVKADNTIETIYMPLLKNKEELSKPRIEPEKWSNKTGRSKAANSGRKRSQTNGLLSQSNELTAPSQTICLEEQKTQSNELTAPSQTIGHTKETSNKIVLNNSLNKGQTHTGSDNSTSDKETKTPIQKSKDTHLNANYSPSEEILNGIPSQYTSEHSEAPQRPNSYYVEFYVKRYKAEHDEEAPYRLDTFALEDLWWQLDYSEEKFDRLVRNYRSDKFWKDKKITVPFLLKYKSISADWNKEPVRIQPEEIHELRRTVRVIDGSQYAGMEAPF